MNMQNLWANGKTFGLKSFLFLSFCRPLTASKQVARRLHAGKHAESKRGFALSFTLIYILLLLCLRFYLFFEMSGA